MSDLTFTDLFCGAGGSSIGLAAAGMRLVVAANHNPRAIETHQANFTAAEHLCKDINNYDMRRLPRTRVLWASPICTEISPAGGRRRAGRKTRRVDGQLDLIEEHGAVRSESFERTRATAFDVIRATEVHQYDAIIVENVIEFATDWTLFHWWVNGIRQLGYQHRIVSVSSAHVAGANNVPAAQWRDRLYVVFMRNGIPMPDLSPRPLAWCAQCTTDVRAVQSWKNLKKYRIGKYRQQYIYRCPAARCRHAIVEPYVAPAASILDWTDLGTRIGDRARPLAASTMARIRTGLAAYADAPSVLTINHGGTDPRAYLPGAAPLATRTGKIGDALLVPAGGTWNTTTSPASNPMRTRTANPKGMDAVLATPAFVADLHRQRTAGGNQHALVVPYYRTGKTKSTTAPLDTITGKDRFALVHPADTGTTIDTSGTDIDDCYFRMLSSRENLRAQRFADSYIVTGNKGEQTMQAGQAVSANVSQWLGEQVATALDSRAAA